jgi:hypothetical protein
MVVVLETTSDVYLEERKHKLSYLRSGWGDGLRA